jgi:hypothetical protein
MATNSQPPVRNPSGNATDQPFGPFADCGNGNPAFYHQFFDDFDDALSTTGGLWVVTPTPGTSVVHTPGDGGLALFTTLAAANSFAEIQLPAASFVPASPQKMFFETRMQVNTLTTNAWISGLINTTAAPFTGGNITDGIYFSKLAGATTINLIVVHGGTVSATVPVPVGAITNYAVNTSFDLAWYLDRHGDIRIFANNQLVGWIPQSGTGTLSPPTNGLGPCARVTGPITLPTANLNVTAAISNGATGGVDTMTVDFICVSKER